MLHFINIKEMKWKLLQTLMDLKSYKIQVETCQNCSQDVWECTAFCGNGKIEKWEDCYNCPKDVKLCKSQTCWNGKIDTDAWEECDNGKNNWKDWKISRL